LAWLDVFSFYGFGRPRKNRGQTGSALGVIGTFLLIAIMFAYCLSTFLRWWDEPPTSSITQRTVSTEAHSVPPVCWTLPHLTNRSRYGVSLRQIAYAADASRNSTIDLPLRRYNASIHGAATLGRSPTNTFCFTPSTALGDYIADEKAKGNLDPYIPPVGVGVVYSFCNPGLCTTLKFKVFLCGTPDPLNPSNPEAIARDGLVCENATVMADTLQNNYLRMEMHTHIGNVINNLAPKVEFGSSHDVLLMYNEEHMLPDLMRSFWEQKLNFLTVYATVFSMIYSYANNPRWVPPPHEVSEVVFHLASFSTITTNSRGTVFDLIGTWGAFFGVIFAVIGVVATRYNMWKFYYKHPKWGRLDHNMQPAASDLDYSASSDDDSACGSTLGSGTRVAIPVDDADAGASLHSGRREHAVPVFGHALWHRLYRVFDRHSIRGVTARVDSAIDHDAATKLV
jgi:uncharacterized membrane protein